MSKKSKPVDATDAIRSYMDLCDGNSGTLDGIPEETQPWADKVKQDFTPIQARAIFDLAENLRKVTLQSRGRKL